MGAVMKPRATYRCPKCGFTYQAALPVRAVTHPCPKTDRHGTRQIVTLVELPPCLFAEAQ